MFKISVLIFICIMCAYFASDAKFVLGLMGLGPQYDREQAQQTIHLIQKYQLTAIFRNILCSLTAQFTTQEFTDVVNGIFGIMNTVDVGVCWSTFTGFTKKIFAWWSNTPKTSSQHSKKSKSANGEKKLPQRKRKSFTVESPKHVLLPASSNQCRDNECQYDASAEQKMTYTVTFSLVKDELSANTDNSMQIYKPLGQNEIISCSELNLFNQLRVQDLLQHHQRDANIADGALAIWIAPESHAESSQTDENANEDVHNKPTCVHDRRQYARSEDTLGMM